MKAALNIASVLDRFSRKAGQAGAWLILPLVFVIMFDVITRKVDFIRLYFSDFSIEYGYSVSTILQDFEWHLHGVILLLTFGFGYLANAHVRVDVFREHIPPRKQAWLEFIGLFIMAVPFLFLVGWQSWILMAISFHQGEGSESLTGIPWRYVIKSFMIIGVVVLSMAVVATLCRLAAYLFGSREEHEEARDSLEIFNYEHHRPE
ncbi:TRAP transporter small permease subunit [Nisaea nitritireducens]|uniref:TRAP transporter small permease subunit n=1 Tax=Nisaea nitritireducens TaxID=568392 RepID=UPI0018689AF8|nr:TRAP transporter small permease subunit [Nisaea nitritireducens]